MNQSRAYRWVTVAFALGLALAVGLAGGCYGRDPFSPNLVPGDSVHHDSTQNQGLLIPPSSHPDARALV
jgi:hypothetical protein